MPLHVFRGMMTQWRVGFGGPVGLDYAALPAVLKFHGVPTKQQRDVFEAVRVLENEALRIWDEQRKRTR